MDSLLSSDRVESNILPDVMDSPLEEKLQKPCVAEDIAGGTNQNAESMSMNFFPVWKCDQSHFWIPPPSPKRLS